MSSLTASQIITGYAHGNAYEAPRLRGLRTLFGRMADASRAANARRSMNGMSEHMLRDLGLCRGDLEGL